MIGNGSFGLDAFPMDEAQEITPAFPGLGLAAAFADCIGVISLVAEVSDLVFVVILLVARDPRSTAELLQGLVDLGHLCI